MKLKDRNTGLCSFHSPSSPFLSFFHVMCWCELGDWINPKTGEIERADNWQERFRHLNHSSHNYLRITRILKCLGEMEYEHLKAPFLRFVLHEAIEEGTLDHTLDSCINYWLEVLKSKEEREDVRKHAQKLADKVNQRSDNQSRQK